MNSFLSSGLVNRIKKIFYTSTRQEFQTKLNTQ